MTGASHTKTSVITQGATIVAINADGLVTCWHDYLDCRLSEGRIAAAMMERQEHNG